jgi:hypothetical protein
MSPVGKGIQEGDPTATLPNNRIERGPTKGGKILKIEQIDDRRALIQAARRLEPHCLDFWVRCVPPRFCLTQEFALVHGRYPLPAAIDAPCSSDTCHCPPSTVIRHRRYLRAVVVRRSPPPANGRCGRPPLRAIRHHPLRTVIRGAGPSAVRRCRARLCATGADVPPAVIGNSRLSSTYIRPWAGAIRPCRGPPLSRV